MGLEDVFKMYCGVKDTTMDGKNFTKVAQDSGYLKKGSGLTTTDLDIMFSKIKAKGARRITFEQFRTGLAGWAPKLKKSVDEVEAEVAASEGPVLKGTKAGKNKLHDDKSNYTGTSAKGGPKNVDSDIIYDISATTNREKADARGVMQTKETTEITKTMGKVVLETKSAPKTTKASAPAAAPASGLEEVFLNYTKGSKEMDGKMFSKLATGSNLITKKVSRTEIDIIFSKIKGDPKVRKIGLDKLEAGLEMIAEKQGCSSEDVMNKVLASGGPTYQGTAMEANRLYDDKSNYSGVHGKGGPSVVDNDKISDISQTCDRTAANAKGVKL